MCKYYIIPKTLPLAVIALLLVTASTAVVAQSFDYGESWMNMGADMRLYWVWGAAEGQRLVLEEFDEEPDLVNLLPLDSADAISEIMTQYYRDAANTHIPWKYMAVVARMRLQGKPDTELNERLRSLREYATYMRSQQQ